MQRPVQARVQAKKGRGCGGVESSIFIVILKSSLSTFFHIGLHFKLNDIYIPWDICIIFPFLHAIARSCFWFGVCYHAAIVFT